MMAVKPGVKSSPNKAKNSKSIKKVAKSNPTKLKKDVPKMKIEKVSKPKVKKNTKSTLSQHTKETSLVKSQQKSIPIKSAVNVELSKGEIKNLKPKAIKNEKKVPGKSILGDKSNLPIKPDDAPAMKKSIKLLKEEPLKVKKSKKTVTNKTVKIKNKKTDVTDTSKNKLNQGKKLKNKKVGVKVNVDSTSSKKLKIDKQKTVVTKEEIKSVKSRKRKHSEITKQSKSACLNEKDVAKFVTALLKLNAHEEKEKKKIFDSEAQPIFLEVTSIKIPKAPLHQCRIPLPHSLVLPGNEVALFVRDLKKGRRIPYEKTVTYFEDLLQQHGVTKVKSVIPMNQLKTEYSQYELKQKLLGLYDHFLVDGRIAGHVAHLLGKKCRQSRKLPVSVHMKKKDLKQEIDTALSKTSLQIHGTGKTSITQVGYCSMSVKEITDNILAIHNALQREFPGGLENIRRLAIKTPLSLSIPIFITLKNKNDVKVPVQAPKRPKAYVPVEGELSTFTSNVKVVVAPDGTVDVQKIDDGSNEDEDTDENEENDEAVSEEDEDDDLKASEGEEDEE